MSGYGPRLTPKLAEALLTGKVFRSVVIHVTTSLSDAGRVTYYEYQLKNVRLLRYKVAGSGQSEQIPTEEIALAFDEATVTYTEYDHTGRALGKVEYTWSAERGGR